MANLVPTQVEQLQRIGAYLRQVRQEQGLSLDLLANQIFIRPALLQALETGREDQLPEPVFIQGFIRRYAEALGLDGKAISQEFVVTPPPVTAATPGMAPATTNGPLPPQASPQADPASVPPLAPALTLDPPPQAAKFPPPKPQMSSRPAALPPMAPVPARRSGFPVWLGWVVAVLLIGGGIGIFLGREPGTETATPSPPETPSAETEPTLDNDPTPAVEPDLAPVALEAPIVVAINLTDRSWISVVADGRTVYEGTSEQGYAETWTAQNSLVFTTGNAGGVALSFNGEDPVVLGNSGMVRTLRLTPTSSADEIGRP